jgi:hypothetical protein
MFAITLGSFVALLLLAIFVAIPGTAIRISPWILPLFLPTMALIALTPAGRRFCDFHRGGLGPTAWTLALFASIALGILLASRVLVPYRHMQYLVVPIAIISAVGAVRWVELSPPRANRRASAAGALSVLLVASALAAYPPADLMGGFNEGANPRVLSSVEWSSMRAQGLVLSDHFESSLLFGFGGVDATWDRAPEGLLAGSWAEAREHLAAVDAPSGTRRVDYALVTEGVEEGAMVTPWDPAAPLSPEALGKFDAMPFQRLYDDGYGRVYIIHWTDA